MDIFLAVEALAVSGEGFSAGAALPGAQVMHALASPLSKQIPAQSLTWWGMGHSPEARGRKKSVRGPLPLGLICPKNLVPSLL